MKNFIFIVFISFYFIGGFSFAEVKLGEVPPVIELKDNIGSRVDGSPWSSREIKDKIIVLFYIDPDFKDLNEETYEVLRKAKFPLTDYQPIAIINLAATWLPNFAISASLKKKQKKYPSTIYVKDYKKHLVKNWGLKDDSSVVLLFDRDGKLLFKKDGKLNSEEIKNLLSLIKQKI